jgi:hypothetical protein
VACWPRGEAHLVALESLTNAAHQGPNSLPDSKNVL